MSSNNDSDQDSKLAQGFWNYRVVKKKRGSLAIHEAYYDENGNVHSLSLDPVSLEKEDLAELKITFELMQEALDEPILDFEEIVQDQEC